MFSHIAEETSRLTHAFLGALFSVVLIFGSEDIWAIIYLCFGLYTVFFFNSLFMHFAYKYFCDGHRFAVLWGVLFLVFFVLGYFALLFGYGLGIFFQFSDNTHDVIVLGIVVFGVFILLSTLANASVIHQKVGKSDDRVST